MLKRFILIGLIFLSGICSAASLWGENANSPILRKADYKVGDSITVIIDENLNAAQSGTTKSDKSNNSNIDITNRNDDTYMPLSSSRRGTTFKETNDARFNLASGGKNTFSGTGKTTRESTIKTTITATVIDVQPNGNLFILGQRQIKVNEEAEQLEVSGIINVNKISDDNTVYSTQLANAKITIKGVGIVASQQQPGLMSKMFEWLF